MRRIVSKRAVLRLVAELMELLACSAALVFTDATYKSVVLGGGISIAGAALFTWAGGFERMEREGRLTLGGPYLFVRHPWILARFLMVFGVILMSRLPLLFLTAMAALTPVYRKMTRDEDLWMSSHLGPKAAEYRALVAGFVPQFLPVRLPQSWRGMEPAAFSWSRALFKRPGRGYLAYAGVIASIAAMSVGVFHLIPDLWWRGMTLITTALAITWLIRDRQLKDGVNLKNLIHGNAT